VGGCYGYPFSHKIAHNHLLIAYIAQLLAPTLHLNIAYWQVNVRGWVDETLTDCASNFEKLLAQHENLLIP